MAEPDFNDLNTALSKVSEVADHINNGIKERQNLEKLLSIQKKLAGTVPVCFLSLYFYIYLFILYLSAYCDSQESIY